jgi:hypothetical protein
MPVGAGVAGYIARKARSHEKLCMIRNFLTQNMAKIQILDNN